MRQQPEVERVIDLAIDDHHDALSKGGRELSLSGRIAQMLRDKQLLREEVSVTDTPPRPDNDLRAENERIRALAQDALDWWESDPDDGDTERDCFDQLREIVGTERKTMSLSDQYKEDNDRLRQANENNLAGWADDRAGLERRSLKLQEENAQLEALLRKDWWLNHGHGYGYLYGDDGEMQCHACSADFKRDPIAQLGARVDEVRSVQAVQLAASRLDKRTV